MSSIASHPQSVAKVSSGRIALLIVLGTESVFFLALLASYAAIRDNIHWDMSHTLTRLTIPLVNSCILLLSALTAWWSNNAIQKDQRTALRNGLLVTLLLGLVFVAGQTYEFTHAGLRIDDDASGGVFFALLAFHAVHVLAGVVFLALNLMRAALGDFTARRHEVVKLGTWFWYYVATVWAVLFTALYLI